MDRNAIADLEEWAERARRKPLVIRGARQVGKTTLVRLFAEGRFDLVELDFERQPRLESFFTDNDRRLCGTTPQGPDPSAASPLHAILVKALIHQIEGDRASVEILTEIAGMTVPSTH